MIKTKLIPFVCGAGAKTAGCEKGPSALKAAGVINHLREEGFDIDWAEDPDVLYAQETGGVAHQNKKSLGTAERQALVLEHVRHLCAQVEKTVSEDHFPITFGGDHAMAAASIAGFAKAKKAQGRVGLIWVDAHPDINTLETSPSQAYHGMPVASLLGMGDPDFVALGQNAENVPPLKPEHVCYMGIRDIDEGEEAYMQELGIRRYDMDKINDMGVAAAFEEALAYLAPKVDYLCLSFDIDALDPSEGLSVGTRVENGFKKDEVFHVLADILSKYRFDLLEIAEYNPTLDGEVTTRAIIFELLELYLRANEISHQDVIEKVAN
jgi:arginase